MAPAAEAAADSKDDLSMLLDAKRRKGEENKAMKERVQKEMTAAMDTGLRVNPVLAAAYGVDVETPRA